MVKIDELPVEMLEKIFTYLSNYSEVSLVNKVFYEVACNVNDSKNCVWLSESILQERTKRPNLKTVMESIQNTRRKIKKLNIDFNEFDSIHLQKRESSVSDVITIVKKFSATIKYLRLCSASLTQSEFLEILLLLPNVECLSLHCLRAVHEKKQSVNDDQLLPLQQLKSLKLDHCDEETVVVFNRLPPGVLKELTLTGSKNLKRVTELFRQQSNIRKLNLSIQQKPEMSSLDNISEYTLVDHIFDHLQLEELECYQHDYDRRYAIFLAEQPTLKTLILRQGKIDGHVLNVITDKLNELETLHINVDTADPFRNIVKLKKLKNLTLQSFNLEILQQFAELENSNISILNLMNYRHNCCISPRTDDNISLLACNVIGKLVISVPNLKVLRFHFHSTPPMISAVMQNFNFLEVLEMHFNDRIGANGFIAIIDDDRCFNPKLTELTIHNFPFEVSLMKKLIRIYPNLKEVQFHVRTSIILSTFKFLLNGFGNMESLQLTTTVGTAEECLDYLRDHKNNLKSVWLTCSPEINSQFTERKERLRAVFDKVVYNGEILYMTNKIV